MLCWYRRFAEYNQQQQQAYGQSLTVAARTNFTIGVLSAGSEPNCRAIAEAVRDAGGHLAFGCDSHTVFPLDHFEHCICITREVDFPQDRVLNVMPRHLPDFPEQRTGKHIAEYTDC